MRQCLVEYSSFTFISLRLVVYSTFTFSPPVAVDSLDHRNQQQNIKHFHFLSLYTRSQNTSSSTMHAYVGYNYIETTKTFGALFALIFIVFLFFLSFIILSISLVNLACMHTIASTCTHLDVHLLTSLRYFSVGNKAHAATQLNEMSLNSAA